MGLSESRMNPLEDAETPQFMKYLDGDPRSPANGRTPLTTNPSFLGDPRSPTDQFQRTPIFEIPEPFDFDKFYGVDADSPNVTKFDNEGYEITPLRLARAGDQDHESSSTHTFVKEHSRMLDKFNCNVHGNPRSPKTEENNPQRRKSIINTSESVASKNSAMLTGSKRKSKRRRSKSAKENKGLGLKRLEFNENYISPSNRSPLATRNFVPLQESPAVKETRTRHEAALRLSKLRNGDSFNDSWTEKENLIPFRHLTYV